MATEIELKARVRHSEALKSLLHEKAEYSSAFEKDDTYWAFPPELCTAARPIPRLRVRRETHRLPGGTSVSATLATYKTKEVRDGIEINDELEFEVKPGPEFERFLETLGYKPVVSKGKRGWAFFREGITAELVEVGKLGWFIELEILVDVMDADKLEKTVAEGKEKLLGFLALLGIGEEAIESRYYTEMLAED